MTSQNNILENAHTRISKILWEKENLQKEKAGHIEKLEACEKYIALSDGVSNALDALSSKLFTEVLDIVQEKLTTALVEILGQPIKFCAESNIKGGTAGVQFWIERDGNREDILLGQGGSVANILSVGLRMFALASLDSNKHRRFLVLDEQDCWLRPELIPSLVKIIHEASTALGLQTLVISHHSLKPFEQYAQNIIVLKRSLNGELNLEYAAEPPEVNDDE